MAQGRHAEAVLAWEELARLRPGDADAVVALGYALTECGRAEDAVQLVEAACRAHPEDARLPHLVGHALQRLGLLEPAIGAYLAALELDARDPFIHASLGSALLARGHAAEAEHHAQEAFRRAPTQAHAATLSCVLIDRGRLAEALEVAERGIATGRAGPEVLVNRSIALDGLGRGMEAEAAARRAMAVAATPVTMHHLAAMLLGHGALTAEAWALYEARLRLRGVRALPARGVRWQGEDVAGRTVLLHAEQGLGDTIQFVRYVPLVAGLGARVVVVVQGALQRLVSGMLDGVATVVAVGGTLPGFDVFAPLLSLPGIFGTTLATIPAPLAWGCDARAGDGALRVGIAWAGSAGFVEDRKRSVPAEMMWGLARAGVSLHSLQLGAGALPVGVADAMAGVSDMQDTAERLSGLDLVVTVDTAVAHLAASMGRPVWLLSRFRGCWRWLEGRSDSPWYPTMRIFRERQPGDWEGVLREVSGALDEAVAG